MAIVAEGTKGLVYLGASKTHEIAAFKAEPTWKPDQELAGDRRAIYCPLYGLSTIGDLFTDRQLVALNTFSDLVQEARMLVLEASGGDVAYSDAVATYLGMRLIRLSDICNSLCRWENTKTQVRNLFTRQAIPMIWDFSEPNVFSDAAGDFGVSIGNLVKALETTPTKGRSVVKQ